ncbi:hypothetical protein IW262DRAFT_1464484 [Armillaria fumosa]|nr:hypothetical protein IW262DRAFT_1464484 [Armillaria fumosa]
MSRENAAMIKGWANIMCPVRSISGLIQHCITYNVNFKLAIPWHYLNLFKWPKDLYSPTEILLVGISFKPGFQEPRLNNTLGSDALYAQYIWGASGMVRRMNMGVAIACGDVLSWITQKLVRMEGVQKLLEGPSYIAVNLKFMSVLSAPNFDGNKFVAKAIIAEEEKGDAHAWTPKAEALMHKRWDKVVQGVTFTLTMDEWESYFNEFQVETEYPRVYAYTTNDSQYGVDLFNITYPVDWSFIKLDAIIIPEVF